MTDRFRIGIVSGKLGGVDGVSLEVDKWIAVLHEMGNEVWTIAGSYPNPVAGVPEDRQIAVPTIRFDSDQQRHYERQFFPHLSKHPPHLSETARQAEVDRLQADGNETAEVLLEHVQQNQIDVLIGQNTNAMPMTLIGGLALFRLATEGRIATILHHHDFWWERSRFSNSRIEPLLTNIMPPVDLGIEHVVISSYAAHILSSLKRVSPHVIPNCEDFDHLVTRDDYNADFRAELGFREDDLLVVQPTRIVPRKRIEDSLHLVGRFLKAYPEHRDRLQFVVSLYQGDEPDNDYVAAIRRSAEEKGIRLHLIADRVAAVRGFAPDGRKRYTNRDVLTHADLVTYLPIWEGFGNALLEAVAARVPIVTTTYLVYKTDIMPAGMSMIEVRDRYDDSHQIVVDDHVLQQIDAVLKDAERSREIVERNLAIAKQEFGFDTLRGKIRGVLDGYADEIRASRRRIRKSMARFSV